VVGIVTRSGKVKRFVEHDFQEALANTLLQKYGISSSWLHGHSVAPYREPCHLVHQDKPLPRRQPYGSVPQCHPSYGRSERDGETYDECEVGKDMPCQDDGVDHADTWWREKRMIAWVWYPYDWSLARLARAERRAGRHGLGLTLEVGWGAHYYGSTPAVILAERGFHAPPSPLIADLVRQARALPGSCDWDAPPPAEPTRRLLQRAAASGG